MSASLVWLRRDLRLYDHAALAEALKYPFPVQPVFVFDIDILALFPNPHDRRLSFLAETLCLMHTALKQRGGGLVILYGKAEELIPRAALALNAEYVFTAKDHEPATRKRDRNVFAVLKEHNIELVPSEDNFIIFPGNPELLTSQKEPYKVFTPFSRHWRKQLPSNAMQEKEVQDTARYAEYGHILSKLEASQIPVLTPDGGSGSLLDKIGYKQVSVEGWNPVNSRQYLARFIQQALPKYKDRRNILADEQGTSHLSPYLRFGLVSPRECGRLAVEIEGVEGAWINELIWRDFYAMILYHLPEFCEQEFYKKYRNLRWNRSSDIFDRWCKGHTGYPVVDAAMRQLNTTGWMHNRARMIVASFLTKHLLVDWRWGEKYFAQHLMDYELSSNVGGWQWAASTGIDPQPYFRIFNPIIQGKKFDPEGEYIRRYVPELASLPTKYIHEPWKGLHPKNYPEPIVQHEEARLQALSFYKQAEL